jgi:hypothetical protein
MAVIAELMKMDEMPGADALGAESLELLSLFKTH